MKKILIVDDESLIRQGLAAALRRDGTCVKAVACGKDALGEIDKLYYDLCFFDVNLPDMNGLDLMKAVKRLSPTTKIIIMTGGMVDDPQVLQSIQSNASLLLSKPFDLDCVKLFVNQILRPGTSMNQAGDHSCSQTGDEPFENRLLVRTRHCERQALTHSTTCTVVASDSEQGEKRFPASILEISEEGMCIRIECLLKPGQLLRFSDKSAPSTGVVQWSKGGGGENSYRAGIQFVMPEGPPDRSREQAQAGGDG